MAKTKDEKTAFLSYLDDHLSKMKSAVIIDYRGLKVKETEQLRKTLRANSVDFNVSKASLVKIALKNQGIEVDESVFKKPIAIAFGMGDEVAVAKELNAFGKEHESLEILGGILERQYIDSAGVKKLAALPSREELYAKMVGSMAAPLSGIVNVLAANIRGLVNVLNAHKEKIVNS